MIKNVVEHLHHADTFGVMAVVLFFTFFAGVLLWAFRMKKSHLQSMAQLPFEDGVVSETSVLERKDLSHE